MILAIWTRLQQKNFKEGGYNWSILHSGHYSRYPHHLLRMSEKNVAGTHTLLLFKSEVALHDIKNSFVDTNAHQDSWYCGIKVSWSIL